ncbi:MarR family transcriptional regulator [Kribbella jejuensis]|uniref:DNA-binding MarR family transcriptional regulator n=1 Tax=Kribbella jejuensis TaxID=236068 RepID=A0A542EU45_9ACTN|nr:MarR family transcriptional regulator [Kribbella jejuensis]TQJ18694.1 DNA-binding MarR family transcriptional regulator [Kribbella jejuensis]
MTRNDEIAAVPPREEWPEPGPQSEGGAALTDVVLATFRLNARLMEAAQGLAANGGLTAAWWQVLGGVLREPHSVADVGRIMGVSRQGVQRIADLLVERGLAEYRPNPAHRRAKLLACTEAGYYAIRQIAVAQHPWTSQLAETVDIDDLRTTLRTMQALITKLEEA